MSEVTSKKLFDLMSRMRSLVPEEGPQPDCSDVVWTEPHHYSSDQKEQLAMIGEKLAVCLQKTLQYYCDENFIVQHDGISEHFAAFLAAEIKPSKKNWYFLSLTATDKSHAGFVEMSFESACLLIGQMLRDPEAQIGQSGELSALEESILLDIVQSLTDAVIDESAMYRVRMLCADHLLMGDWPVRFRDLEDMTRFSFSAECGKVKFSLAYCFRDEMFDPTVGIQPLVYTAEEMKKCPERVIECLREAAMNVRAQLSSATMSFNDMLTLEKGDVIVLGRKTDTPIDVLVNGQMCFRAWPVQHAGRAAIQMTTFERDQ
jgi:flagellar motor switch protein FliM